MAEFLNQETEPALSPMNMMGKPIPFAAREEGYRHCQEMGMSKEKACECVGAVCEALQRDKPYEAMGAGMKFLDLTGVYRLFAVVLTEAARLESLEPSDG